jgi:hypothetical protein
MLAVQEYHPTNVHPTGESVQAVSDRSLNANFVIVGNMVAKESKPGRVSLQTGSVGKSHLSGLGRKPPKVRRCVSCCLASADFRIRVIRRPPDSSASRRHRQEFAPVLRLLRISKPKRSRPPARQNLDEGQSGQIHRGHDRMGYRRNLYAFNDSRSTALNRPLSRSTRCQQSSSLDQSRCGTAG